MPNESNLQPLKIELVAVDNASATISSVEKNIKSFSKTQTINAKTMSESTKSNKDFTSSILKLGISYATLRRFASFFGEVAEESASMVEALNLFEVAMGENVDRAKEFVEQMEDVLGLDKTALIEYAGLFNQMALAIGNTTETAYIMSEALTRIGADIASLYNIDVETAMSKLRSGIAGQVKPVRELGMDITSISLDRLLQEQLKLEGVTSKTLSQAQKQLGRTILLIQQSENAWGDMAKTIDSYSNQQKVLEAQVLKLKRALGDLFVGTAENAGIMTQAIRWVNASIMALTDIIRAYIPEIEESGFNTDKQVENNEELASSFEEVDESIKGSLLSFDKFNALNKSEDVLGDQQISDLLDSKLIEEYERYMEKYNKTLEETNMLAKEYAEQIKNWIGVNEEGKITWDSLNGVLKVGIGLIGTLLTNSIIKAISSFGMFAQTLATTNGLMQTLSGSAIFGVILIIIDLIQNWEKLNDVEKSFKITLAIILTMLTVFINQGNNLKDVLLTIGGHLYNLTIKFTQLKAPMTSVLGIGFGVVSTIVQIFNLVSNWNNFSALDRFIALLGIVATILGTVMFAMGNVFAGTMLLAGGAIASFGISQKYNGSTIENTPSISTGEEFMTSETVGNTTPKSRRSRNAGGEASESITQGVYNAVNDALINNGSKSKQQPINIYLDKKLVGRATADTVYQELVRVGKI